MHDASRGHVLVVDDEREIRDVLTTLLVEEGYGCIQASDAEEAMSKLCQSQFDCVLSDVHMPGMGGIELLRQIKLTHRDVAVIMVTGDTNLAGALDTIRLGAYDYLTKPFNLDVVALTVDRAIEKKRLIEENRQYQRTLERKVEERTGELREKHEELRRLFLNTIRALAHAMEAKDSYTQGHSRRVASDAVRVAQYLALPPEEVEDLRLAGLLHDIGKIGVHEKVLSKPGKLDKEEWELVRQHPVLAEMILSPIAELGGIIKVIRHHHERYDGQGYPDGLKGNEIPLGARILAVADSYDAMTSARPYRAAHSAQDAIAEIERQSGTQFDPVIATAFISAAASGERGVGDPQDTDVDDSMQNAKNLRGTARPRPSAGMADGT